jgi:uncharacterized protein YhfF
MPFTLPSPHKRGEGETAIMTELERFAFGDKAAMATELAGLVAKGEKTASCWAAVHGDQGAFVGQQFIVTDGRDRDVAIIETVELSERRYDQIDEEWAKAEGEGDCSLEAWRKAHEAFFKREGVFAPDMPLWCERFKLVKVLPLGSTK